MRGNVEPAPTVYQPPSGERALRIANLNDIEEEAAKVIPRGAFAYIAAGSANEWTLRENRRAFDRHALRSRALLLAKHSAADPLHSRGESFQARFGDLDHDHRPTRGQIP
jgi:FMN-dependent dehydrogenase